MENLGRGVVAVRSTTTEVFVSWRVLGTDPPDTAFNLYRSTGGAPTLLNATPITGATQFVDNTADPANLIRALSSCRSWARAQRVLHLLPLPAVPHLRPPLAGGPARGRASGGGEVTPTARTTPASATSTATASTRSSSNGTRRTRRTTRRAGYTGNVYLDAYKLDGTRLWRIDLGRNIRAGAHYTQFRSTTSTATAGRGRVQDRRRHRGRRGNVIGDANADFRNSAGYILTGPSS